MPAKDKKQGFITKVKVTFFVKLLILPHTFTIQQHLAIASLIYYIYNRINNFGLRLKKQILDAFPITKQTKIQKSTFSLFAFIWESTYINPFSYFAIRKHLEIHFNYGKLGKRKKYVSNFCDWEITIMHFKYMNLRNHKKRTKLMNVSFKDGVMRWKSARCTSGSRFHIFNN